MVIQSPRDEERNTIGIMRSIGGMMPAGSIVPVGITEEKKVPQRKAEEEEEGRSSTR
jgi:hypothetical protein